MSRLTTIHVLFVSLIALPLAVLADEPESAPSRVVVVPETVLSDGAFGGLTPGDAFTPDARWQLEWEVETRSRWLLPGGYSLDSMAVDQVAVDTDGGLISTIVVQASTDAAGAPRGNELAGRMCAVLGGLERYIPSPLGTPDPDAPEEWNPVITSTGECSGAAGTSQLTVRVEEAWADGPDSPERPNFHRLDLIVTLNRAE